MPNLKERIARIDAETRDVFGPHNERMASFVETIRQSGRRPQPGSVAPDFALPTAEGKMAKLADLMGPSGLVLLFIRGLWCPYCNAQMTSFEESAADLEAAGLSVAIITPEVGGRAAETKEALKLSAAVLCDVDEGVALRYGCLVPVPEEDRAFLRAAGYDLAALYGNEAWFMPLASTFVIDPDHRIRAVLGGADQRWRPDPDAVLQAAGAAQRGS